MKKFLSLVLAMIMTMSLVTISAGATEYKDLTDKDEIKYEEAVAVLNRIGVITGYSDGSFQPETELTRGAAAKIIVSLMIGPDAAAALPNTSSPYPDVPAGHTFAGVIGFCKTKGYISGYGDGNFKPAGTLTGYAFAKMLLGALGYSSDIERFTGSGWTMNVANIGNVAGLFDRISFDGAAAVTRDEACQLALNTLKATMVTYGGTSVVNGSTGSYTIQGTQATPRTSNNRDINANIGRKDWYGGNNQGSDYLTLEFGEEHFKDLRLEHDRYDPAHDEFGRPSNEWSYKKVTIGTFPLPADFTFTTQVAHIEDTDGTKEKALGLRNYDLVADGGYSIWNGWGNNNANNRPTILDDYTTTLWQNGEEIEDFFNDKKVANIADFTDNGTLVEVYVSYVDADWITDVVVVQTQMMEVDKVGSDYVSLATIKPDAQGHPSETVADGKTANIGFNLSPIHVAIAQVKDTNEDCYDILKDLKSGDKVAVVPVTTDNGKTWEAAEVYVPETVTGSLTRVDTYGIGKDTDDKRGAIEITVGGTSYKIADWNKDMWGINAADIKSTRKDVTLLMDKYGNAMLINDKGATSNFMVIGNYYQALVGNKVCTFVHGWDIGGEEVDLNLGSNVKIANHGSSKSVYGHVIGELVYYTSDGTNGDADYRLDHKENNQYKKAVFDVYTNVNKDVTTKVVDGASDSYEIKASNVTIPLADNKGNPFQDGTYGDQTVQSGLALHPKFNDVDYSTYYYDKGVVFIYVSYGEDDEIESIEFKKGVQNATNNELRFTIQGWASQAAVKDELVKAVVIKTDSADASVNNMLYVTDTKGYKEVDKETNESFFEVEVAMFTADGKFLTEQHIMVNKDLQIGDFATYTKVAGTKYEDNYYRVKQFTRHNTQPAVLTTLGVDEVTSTVDVGSKVVPHLIRVAGAETVLGDSLVKPIAGHEGSDATTDESYILGGYRGAGTDVFSTPSLAEGVINTARAEWLNATGNKNFDDVDSAEDLLDLKNVDFSKVVLDILLNEKPDSDGFRTAYLIVLKSIPDGSSGDLTGSGNVVLAKDFDQKMIASAPTGNIDIANNGNYRFSYTLAAPAWVAEGADCTVNWTLYSRMKDSTTWEVENSGTDTSTLDGRTIKETQTWTVGAIPKDSDVKLEIDSVSYDEVVVRYWKDEATAGNELDAKNLYKLGGTFGAPETMLTTTGTFNFGYPTTQIAKTVTASITGIDETVVNKAMAADGGSNNRFWLDGDPTYTLTATGEGYVDIVVNTENLDARYSIVGTNGLNTHGGYNVGQGFYVFFNPITDIVPGTQCKIDSFHLLDLATQSDGGLDARAGEKSIKITFTATNATPAEFTVLFDNMNDNDNLTTSVPYYWLTPTGDVEISVKDVEILDAPTLSEGDISVKTATAGTFASGDKLVIRLPGDANFEDLDRHHAVGWERFEFVGGATMAIDQTSGTVVTDSNDGERYFQIDITNPTASESVKMTIKPGALHFGGSDWTSCNTETYVITLSLDVSSTPTITFETK